MFTQLKELYSLLTAEQRSKLKRLQMLVVLMAFAEIAGVASIGPFMALVGDINQLKSDGVIGEIYRASGISEPRDFLFSMGVMVLVVLAVASCISMFTIWRISMYGQVVGAELSSRLFRHYMHQSWIFHASGNSSNLVNRTSQECLRITNNIINPLMQMNAKIVLVFFMALAIFVYNPWVAMTGIGIFLSVYFILFRTVRSKLKQNGDFVTEMQQLRFKLLAEGLGGIKDVLLLGRQEVFVDRYVQASKNFAKSQGTNLALGLVPRYALEFIAFGSVIFLILFLLSAHDGNLGEILPVLSVYALAGFKLLPAFQHIYTSLSNIRGNIAAFEDISFDLKESLQSSEEQLCSRYGARETLKSKSNISLQNITFYYPEKKTPALHNFNLEIPANQIIGLVGASGSGKSTAIDMILGLIQPTKGELVIDGRVVDDNIIRIWQNSIGFVPQAIFLSDSSIRENIAFGLSSQDIDDSAVTRAIKMAHLKELIDSLPEGLDTLVGERGVQLSGGQRQRIGIARALYHDADVLVLDEATSALDGITEKMIMDAIHDFSGKKTIIMIAHRLATVKQCDRIYLLKDGKIEACGTFDELVENNTSFSKMVEHS
ncbi:ABC transporter ATP-binding protein [Cobetia amphilecti]|uniref:ABC transporter ATP-binding protein n=1 Tax=Cobetia amphilecti TaxID=1055104 RepID=UPI00254A373D|nr:ABC transporter ATP-binding protein [Cobetia amphilecti]